MRKILVLFTVLTCLTELGLAQSNPANLIRTDLIPPSPTAAGLARYGEIPINLATGSVGLSIPLVTAAGHDLSVPITLNYSYDGFRPSQPIGWVGLGWNLQAGGVITRTVRDKVDNSLSSGSNFDDSFVQAEVTSSTPSQTFLHNAAALYDTEQDIYNFSFGNFSGKFIEFNGTFYCLPYQKFKITFGGNAFTIITDDGTQYYFEDVEYTRPKGSSGAPYNIPLHISSWYLSSIKNAAGTELVKFVYDAEPRMARNGSQTQSYKKFDTFYHGESNMLTAISSGFPSYVDPLRLTQIITEKHTVNFGATPIYDVPGNRNALNTVKLVDHTTGRTLKSFKFNYEYFPALDTSMNFKYLKLKSLDEYELDTSGNEIDTAHKQRHLFDYENETSNFPDKSIALVDHFGYYKGGTFSSVMLPDNIYTVGGAPNRDPDETGTKYGALKKITYPTKGYTTFEYENNRSGGGETTYSVINTSKNPYITRPSGSPTGTFSKTYQFRINFTQNISFNVVRTVKTPHSDNNARNLTPDVIVYGTDTSSNAVSHSMSIDLESDNSGKMFTYTFAPGTYNVETTIDSKEDEMMAQFAYNNFDFTNPTVTAGAIAGGLRIKKLISYPLAGEPIEKNYRYASGSFEAPNYDTKPFTQRTVETGCTVFDTNATTYTSNLAEAFNQNITNYYGTVYEDLKGPEGTLTTRNDFVSFASDYCGIAPSAIIKYKNTANGLEPISKTEYTYEVRSVGPSFRNIRPYQTLEVIITGTCGWGFPFYEYSFDSGIFEPRIKLLKSTTETSYEGLNAMAVTTNNIYDVADTYNLMMATTTTSDGKKIISKYKYPDNYTSGVSSAFVTANVLQPAWESQVWKKTGSDSVLVSAGITEFSSTKFKPVKQYLLTTLGVTAMNAEGLTGTKYNSLLSDSRYELRATYTYDTVGRTISQKLTGGTPTSYKWGYAANTTYHPIVLGQKNYPIAEAKNALPTEFYFENFEEHGSATYGNAHTGSKFYNGDFSVGWSVPNGRDYRLSYWYRVGGVWKLQEQAYSGSTTLSLGDAVDDIRIYPKDALISTYAYKSGAGMSSQTDAKGLDMFYEYDGYNRLENLKDRNRDIVKNYQYNLGGVGTGMYYNRELNTYFRKNDCGGSYFGSRVLYTIPANTYISNTQVGADALATAAAAAAGQSFANANGTCINPVAVSLVNDTYATSPDDADITSLVVKDAEGNVLYTFNQSQIAAGFSLPQGTYTMTFTIIDHTSTFPSWGACSITSGSNFSEFYNNWGSTYTISNVVLSSSTATIYLGLLVS